MSIIGRIARPSASTTLERLIREVYGGHASAAGMTVNEESAMRVAAVYTCVLVLSQSVAQTPLHLYRKNGRSKEKAQDHYLYELFHDQPNEWMTSFEAKQLIMVHKLLRGNSVWLKTGLPTSNKIIEVIPLHPDLIEKIEQDERYRLNYKVKRPGTGITDDIPGERVIHFRGMSFNGFTGVSPLTYAREMIGIAMATEKHAAKLFSNGTRLSGTLNHPAQMSPEAYDRLIASWHDTYAGVENAHKTALLEEGVKFEKISMTAEDAQFIESRKYQRSEIAGFFRVPAHMINDLEKATFSNVEHLDLAFVKHSLMPWLVSIESTLRKDTMTPEEKKQYYFKFNVDGLLRGDMKTRSEAQQKGVMGGWLSPNEVREMEDMNPYEGGDEYRVPLNTEPAGAENEPKNPTEN